MATLQLDHAVRRKRGLRHPFRSMPLSGNLNTSRPGSSCFPAHAFPVPTHPATGWLQQNIHGSCLRNHKTSSEIIYAKAAVELRRKRNPKAFTASPHSQIRTSLLSLSRLATHLNHALPSARPLLPRALFETSPIEWNFGRLLNFMCTAHDSPSTSCGEGKGLHTRP
jgi:hypothetical protein